MNTPPPIEEMVYLLRLEDDRAALRIDEPARLEGEWWIDGTFLGQSLTLSWKQGRGFGIYRSCQNYGDQPEAIVDSPTQALLKVNKLRAEARTSTLSSNAH